MYVALEVSSITSAPIGAYDCNFPSNNEYSTVNYMPLCSKKKERKNFPKVANNG